MTTDTYTVDLLPTVKDHERYVAEDATRLVRQLREMVLRLTQASLLNGHEHTADIPGARLGIEVRADEGHETYVAIRVMGPVPNNLTAAILALVPGCDRDSWYPEVGTRSRQAEPNEQIWSNIMDPAAAAKVLNASN